MDRENTTNRKRTRVEDDKEKNDHQCKKQEIPDDHKWYEIGVFDFPWLKEGLIFKTEDYLDDHDEKFSPCSYLDESPAMFAAKFDQPCAENQCVSPFPDEKKLDDECSWSLLVDDDLEQVDCIWSCVIDQPLDIGFNKW